MSFLWHRALEAQAFEQFQVAFGVLVLLCAGLVTLECRPY